MPLIHTGQEWTKPNTTGVGTGVATVETDLQTLVIPAAMLTTGDLVRIFADLQTTGSASTKTATLYFGATQLTTHQNASGNNGDIVLMAELIVTGATAQKGAGRTHAGLVTYVTPAETIANAITVKTTGTTPNSADEVTSQVLSVEVIPG